MSSSSSSSSSSGSLNTHSSTSTEIYFHEPFESYKIKAQTLCKSIGFGEVLVEWMNGGSFNRVSKLTLASGEQCVLRVPRDVVPDPVVHTQTVKDQIGIISFTSKILPVPEILAYDTTADNAIESPYTIQKLAPGQSLAEVFRGDLTTEDRFQIVSIVADIIIRMERVSFPTPGRLVTAPGIPDRCDNFSTISTSVVIAPFKIRNGEVLESTSSASVADFMGAILDAYYETSQIKKNPLLPRWTRLREINREMKSQCLLTCQQPVLWHWDFNPRNIIVDRTPDNNWEITAVLDWDGVLSVPRVLTREPPVWLWQLDDQPDQGCADDGMQIPRQLTSQEEIIKQHFDDCIKASVSFDDYRTDAYDKGRWARRLFDYAHDPFMDSVDWKTYEVFNKDWEAYYLEHAIAGKPHILEKPESCPETAKIKARSCTSWFHSAFKKIFTRGRSNAFGKIFGK